MADQSPDQTMTDAEVQAFTEKLEAWGQGLPQKEQAFLLEILARAASAEVQGYALVDYFMKERGGPSDAYYKVTLEDVLISSFQVGPVLQDIAGQTGQGGGPHVRG
ncbi:MAG: hypothetical protein ACRDJE_00715 [Dehalococcoidia bacterium]